MNPMEAFTNAIFNSKLKDVQREIDGKPPAPTMLDWFREISQIPGKADNIAEENFPNDLRDSSQKNAFRHALGTGMMAQHFGAGKGSRIGDAVGKATAKTAGALWETFGYVGDPQKVFDAKYNQDTQHDLNANQLGAQAAQRTANTPDLISALRAMADSARREAPPSAFQSSPGYMTYTARPTNR